MATLSSTFIEYYEATADPYADNRAALPNAFAHGAGEGPAALVQHSEQDEYPIPFLVATPDHVPLVIVAPWSERVLPGRARAPTRYAFAGDVVKG